MAAWSAERMARRSSDTSAGALYTREAESDPANPANPAACRLTSIYAVAKIVLQSPQDWAYNPQTPQVCGV
jgi:hypothetical protein